jgi:hypothetical protein
MVDAALGSPVDYHFTVLWIPRKEMTSRAGTWNLTCP